MLKRSTITAITILLCSVCISQVPLSVATDFDVQHNFRKQQQYWAVGTHTQFCFHITPVDGIYGWFGFYTNGRFINHLSGTAKSPTTLPQHINYSDTTKMRIKHISFGWRKYIKGLPDIEKGWNLYGCAGFGLLMGQVNNYSKARPDSMLYDLPIRGGEANFKRLTIDLGLGVEVPFASDMYFYSEIRAFIPTTDYPSKYILVNEKAPGFGSLGAGIRILF